MTTPKPTRQQRLDARSRYYALGRFVEEFELMVDAMRSASLGLIEGIEPPYADMKVYLVLTHSSMTAGPLMQVLRGMLGQTMRYHEGLTEQRKKEFMALVGQINSDQSKLVEARNAILHGTWRTSPQDFSLEIYNFRSSLDDGLRSPPIANSAQEFFMLARRARRLAKMILRLAPTARVHNFDRSVLYVNRNGRWCANTSVHG